MNQQSGRAVRIAHLSDLHYAPTTIAEVGPCMESAVSDAIAANVDVAIITGDSTDRPLGAHVPAFQDFVRQVQRLANHCPVLLLQGTFSHEPLGMLHLFSFVSARFGIEVVDRIGQIALIDKRWKWVQSAGECRGADLVVSAVPTVNRADLIASVGAEHVAQAMGDVLAGLMAGVFAPINRELRAMGIPTVLIGHGTVSGARTETGVPMDGLDHEFTTGGLYAALCSAVMLGHIHQHQSWSREFEGVSQLIAYAGSIGRNHWGETGKRGFLIWEVLARSASFDFVETPACRMVDFTFEGAPDLDYLRTNASDLSGAFVRVTYEIDEEFASTVDRKAIREILRMAQEVHIDGRVIPAIRRRAPGISRLASLALKAARWCEATGNEAEASMIVPRLEMLQTSDPQTIATSILKGLQHEKNDQGNRRADAVDGVDAVACGPV
ncbi:metallophosphatase family protein [Burkholderia sp. Ac-20365]|uniref:metallophosphoesterase family protein n=1 Tax=Burkholderia sp. Ac-20365 TaxID=2703897 RepID=UPI00197BA72C|nr:metallophosphatase family protein [Burkholderia sp. Ac-20365]MBN3760975.1 metallophosphatase family protein [Burkholderia sp. Ac-20365]